MKLTDLKPKFLRIVYPCHQVEYIDDLSAADGIMFLCPKCFKQNQGSVDTHPVICWAPTVSDTTVSGPGRWTLEGTGYEDLSLTASSSSIRLTSGCQAHFFVEKGQVRLV